MSFLCEFFYNRFGGLQSFLNLPWRLLYSLARPKKLSLWYSSKRLFILWPPFWEKKWNDALFHSWQVVYNSRQNTSHGFILFDDANKSMCFWNFSISPHNLPNLCLAWVALLKSDLVIVPFSDLSSEVLPPFIICFLLCITTIHIHSSPGYRQWVGF